MSTENYLEAIRLIAANPGQADFPGPTAEELIQSAEDKLCTQFPPLYRSFLGKLGTLSIGSEEIYGVFESAMRIASVPDVVWFNLVGRQEGSLPTRFLAIYSVGNGELLGLDLARLNNTGESPVVSFWPGFPPEAQTYEVVAQDFGEFLLDRVSFALETDEG